MSSCFQFAIFQHNLSTVVEAEKKDREKEKEKKNADFEYTIYSRSREWNDFLVL